MRRDLTKPKRAQRGDEIVIALRLPASAQTGRISVWSRAGADDFSPHVPMMAYAATVEGKPAMASPTYMRLHEGKRRATMKLVADEDLDILVRQEIDTQADIAVAARVRIHGKASQAIRRYLRNALRALRGDPAPHVRHS